MFAIVLTEFLTLSQGNLHLRSIINLQSTDKYRWNLNTAYILYETTRLRLMFLLANQRAAVRYVQIVRPKWGALIGSRLKTVLMQS